VNALKTTLPSCQVYKGSGELEVFERLSGQHLAMSQTRGIQTTLKALKQQIDIARLPSAKNDIAKL
jgi:hypothetical protein